MLHHVPSVALQDRVFVEVHRVLKLGGIFVGTDSQLSWWMKIFHIHDTLVVVNPVTLPHRLEVAGFTGVNVETNNSRFRFLGVRTS
jgi:hypothetical protein